MKITTISSLALVLAIGSACGKKKEGPREEAAPAPTPATAPAAPVTPNQVTPVNPAPPVGDAPAAPTNSEPQIQQQQSDFDAPTTKTVTGRKLNNGQVFTGAGSDSILGLLRQKESRLSADQQQRNADWADQIASAEWLQDESTKESVVHLRVFEGSRIVHYNLKSVLLDNQTSRAVVISEAYGQATTGSQNLKAQMKCLDLNVDSAKCSTALLAVTTLGDTTQIILRDTVADLHYELFETEGNPEHALIREFLKNSAFQKNTPDRVSAIYYQSYEVLNGKSGFIIDIIGRNKQYLGFSGSLLAEESGSSIQSNAGKKYWNSREMEARGFADSSISMLNTLSNVRLINNDGQGKIRLRVSQRPYGGFKLDQFNLTFMRRASALVQLDESVLTFE